MANRLYPLARQAFAAGQINWTTPGNIAAIAVTAGYTYSDLHEFLTSVPAGARVATAFLTSRTNALGVCDCDDIAFGSPAAGPAVTGIVVHTDTGNPASSRLIAFYDSLASGSPINVTPNGTPLTATISNGPTRLFRV